MNNVCPKFSFIIPNYNKGKYIGECINSIINQTYKDYEIIAIDDGSNDNSIEEIKKFDVKLYNTDRLQAGGARNLGIKVANGEYIIFIDSDDYLADNNVLRELNNQINDEDLIFLNYTLNNFGTIEKIYDIKGNIATKIEKTKFLGAPTKCFKKSLINDIEFPECQRYEDIAFTIEAMCKAKKYSEFNNSFFVYRRVLSSNSTAKIDINSMIAIISELIKLYKLTVKYPKYKYNILNRIKNDKLEVRFKILNYMIENNISDVEMSKFYDMMNFYNNAD